MKHSAAIICCISFAIAVTGCNTNPMAGNWVSSEGTKPIDAVNLNLRDDLTFKMTAPENGEIIAAGKYHLEDNRLIMYKAEGSPEDKDNWTFTWSQPADDTLVLVRHGKTKDLRMTLQRQ